MHAVLRFGGSDTQGQVITLTQSDKWLRQAGVLDTWTITTIDTALAFRLLPSIYVNIIFYTEMACVLQAGVPRLHLPGVQQLAAVPGGVRVTGGARAGARDGAAGAVRRPQPHPHHADTAAQQHRQPRPPRQEAGRQVISQYSSVTFSLLEVLLVCMCSIKIFTT